MDRASGELPSGIVTFVFTDIEGSTRLLIGLQDRFGPVIERHRELLRSSWAKYGGHEVFTEGDGSLVAFEEPAAALAACVEAQRALAAEQWPEAVEVRVRMGVHTGLAAPYRGDYLALAVNQASRVVSAAHGGQILVSEAAAAPGGLDLRPLGRFRLRDFDEPVRLFQVVEPDLPDEFPAVRAVPAEGHNLVRPPNRTIDRRYLAESVAAELQPGRVVTLVGPGGVGKSRLAVEAGLIAAADWPDGIWRVDLAPTSEPDLVAPAIAASFGVRAPPGRDCWEALLEDLAGKRTVALLDNCDHVADKVQGLVESLLGACPSVAVLATSRTPLHVGGEVVVAVPPLSATARVAEEAPAVRLFLDRAKSAKPNLVVDDVATVVEICRRLDGLPLAIELAAANLSVSSMTEILAGLSDPIRILRRHAQPEGRHAALETVLGWSHRLLDDDERRAFRRLSVFGGSFSIGDASAAVAADDISSAQVASLVFSLADRSLIVVEPAANDTRYSMLETVRAYGRERLAEAAEGVEVAGRVARHLLDTLGPWHPADVAWRDGVEQEVDNLRALIPMLAEVEPETAQTLICTIGRYHDAVFSFRAGIGELERYVEMVPEPSSVQAVVLSTLAFLHLRLDETEAAGRLVDDAQQVAAVHGVPVWDDASVERARGEIARREGRLTDAIDIARAALDRKLSPRGQSRMYNLWGTTAAANGDFETAKMALAKELELSVEVGYEGYITSAYGNLAEVSLRLGEFQAAAHNQRRCLELAVAQGAVPLVAFSLIVAARLAGSRGDWEEAVRLHARADALLEEIGLVLYEDDRRESDELLTAAKQALGDDEFDQVSRQGEAVGLPEAIDEATAVFTTIETATHQPI